MLRVYGHRRRQRSSRQVSVAHASCIQLQTLTAIPKTVLSVTNSLVYGAVDRRSADELSHYYVVDECQWCIEWASLQI